jgi:predicted O-methyltransferase YrrM
MPEISNHTVFQSDQIQSLLKRLHAEASAADEPFVSKFSTMPVGEREALQDDYRRFYGLAREAYIPVAEEFGRLLYLMARATRASTIVEFGTSFGISTIYLASALRDNGGGHLITCELEATKSQRAQAHLAEAGLSDLVEFRIGDALEVLNEDIAAPVDMLLLDGAKPLYFRVLKLIEPFLRPGALITSDNINTRMKVSEFTDYIRQPVNGYISVAVPLEDGIELSMRTSEA